MRLIYSGSKIDLKAIRYLQCTKILYLPGTDTLCIVAVRPSLLRRPRDTAPWPARQAVGQSSPLSEKEFLNYPSEKTTGLAQSNWLTDTPVNQSGQVQYPNSPLGISSGFMITYHSQEESGSKFSDDTDKWDMHARSGWYRL